MKRFLAAAMCICLINGLVPGSAFAREDSGKIDLYEVFSNKEDRMKTEVGSRVYKWSMHLPDDAIVYKSENVNYFNMSTNSYQASIDLQVNKNKDELTLEDILYKMQNSSRRDNYWMWGDKEFYVDIAKDELGQRFIRIIKAESFYDYYMVDEAAEEFRDYIENRIYIANNYIYSLTVRMNGEFYRQHEEMFEKLISSFKVAFDENNPYIKELSDSVSTTREFKNTSYGWKITMSPYWKVEGTPNARHQEFRPVYTDEELNMDEAKKEKEEEFNIQEGITVSLISSAGSGETASDWASKEIEMLKDNYSSDVYEILKNEGKNQSNMDVKHVVVRYKTVTKNPYIVHSIYVVGNGYKYLVSATMKEEKYQDLSKRKGFEDMLNSFTLDSENLSKYLGKIVSAESLIDLNGLKELKTKKYDFKTQVTKSWDTSSSMDGFPMGYYYDDYYYKYGDAGYRGDISNNEFVDAFEPVSNIHMNMSAGLNANEMKQIITDRVSKYLMDNEINIGLADVSIQSAEHDGALLYYVKKEYDLNAIKKFVDEDATKIYDLENLTNEYEYIIKTGKDMFIQSVTVPVANATDKNKVKINGIWENTSVNKVNYSKLALEWTDHELQEFDTSNVNGGAENQQ